MIKRKNKKVHFHVIWFNIDYMDQEVSGPLKVATICHFRGSKTGTVKNLDKNLEIYWSLIEGSVYMKIVFPGNLGAKLFFKFNGYRNCISKIVNCYIGYQKLE
jgi:hypothetical protein